MKEDFIVFCLTLQNFLISSLYALTKVIIGDGDRSWGISLRFADDIRLKPIDADQ